jgi:Tfp pilus assembly protein PilF
MKRKDSSAAISTLEQGLKMVPEDPVLLHSLAGIYESSKDYPKAFAAYERILKKDPENALAINNLAALLVDHKGDADSLKRARELAKPLESTGQPAFIDTLGWVYYKSGETDKAVTLLSKAVEKAPQVLVFQYHLGMAYHKKGDVSAAKTHLAKAVEAKVDFPGIDEARQTLATLSN